MIAGKNVHSINIVDLKHINRSVVDPETLSIRKEIMESYHRYRLGECTKSIYLNFIYPIL